MLVNQSATTNASPTAETTKAPDPTQVKTPCSSCSISKFALRIAASGVVIAPESPVSDLGQIL